MQPNKHHTLVLASHCLLYVAERNVLAKSCGRECRTIFLVNDTGFMLGFGEEVMQDLSIGSLEILGITGWYLL